MAHGGGDAVPRAQEPGDGARLLGTLYDDQLHPSGAPRTPSPWDHLYERYRRGKADPAPHPEGVQRLPPGQALRRLYVTERLRRVLEGWGYQPLERPTLEYADVLLGRYEAEAEKLIYRFQDFGGRDVALRYDQTVPFARVVAQHLHLPPSLPALPVPARLAGENTSRGREREFTQGDVDVAGGAGTVADAETLAIASAGYRAIGFPRLRILVNDRTLFDQLGLSKPEVIAVDKLAKIGADGVVREAGCSSSERGRDLLERLREAPWAWKRCWPPPWTQGCPPRTWSTILLARGLGTPAPCWR